MKKISILCLLALIPSISFADISFEKTQDQSKLELKKELFKSDAEKEFLKSGKNIYINDVDSIKKGKRIFNLYSCTACHGGKAEGAVGPSLQGPNFRYAKNSTNKGMFETIWNGTNGGMGAKGYGLMAPDDGLSIDDVLLVQSYIRSNSKITGNP